MKKYFVMEKKERKFGFAFMRASVLENESFPTFETSMETLISVFYVLEDPSIQKQDEYK